MTRRLKILFFFRWLQPGLRIKRWVALSLWGVFLILVGSNRLGIEKLVFLKALEYFVIVLGVGFLFVGVIELILSILSLFFPTKNKSVRKVVKIRLLEKGPKIVAIGGGTGLAVLLQGIKEYTSNIKAVVTVADDGGSSGRLREQFDILPPGDIRNCLVALADTEQLMRDLFQFRFKGDSELSGHSFGNLFITAMTQLTGDFEKAIKESSKVLAIRGQVVPSTLYKVNLGAEYNDGSVVIGEADIPKKKLPIKRVFLKSQQDRPLVATAEVIKSINEADAIILGPGSLYTSIIPNLLITDIADAIAASNAKKFYICNAMTQVGETTQFSASDHISTLIAHSNRHILDYCVVNNKVIPEELLDRYKNEGSQPVVIDREKVRTMGYRLLEQDLIAVDGYVRHDFRKLARLLVKLIK
ncbi:MAG: YvcK family protein [Candidatus Gygaella obscura]|nr:YvcK family protein [Candidatus Gygaella obscura]